MCKSQPQCTTCCFEVSLGDGVGYSPDGIGRGRRTPRTPSQFSGDHESSGCLTEHLSDLNLFSSEDGCVLIGPQGPQAKGS